MSDSGQVPSDDLQFSASFYAPDGDVTFKSCDNIIFKVHRKNLDTHSEGFGPPERLVTADPDESIVSLPETAQVMELLFRYMYPMRQPELKHTAFETLASLSEAVEKYQVFSAMEICKLYMEAATASHPFEVLCYAAKHGYADLMDIAEEQATGMSLEEAYVGLTLEMYVAWTRYHGRWLDVLDYAHHLKGPVADHVGPGPTCELWKRLFAETASRLGGNPRSLRTLDDVFRPQDAKPAGTANPIPGPMHLQMSRLMNQGSSCTNCYNSIVDWRQSVEAKLQGLPKLNTFLSS
jgi:hypothetical protein